MLHKVSPTLDEDAKSMLAFKDGDKSSFDIILIKYEKSLINFIYRFFGNQIDAEEIAQEVFLKIYLSAKSYSPSAKYSTWFYRVAMNLCIDYQRKRKLNTVPLDNPIGTDEGEIIREISDMSYRTPDVSVEKKHISETIHSAFYSLPANQRIALSLKIYDDKSYKEISDILGCSVSAVESLLFRARQLLRSKLRFMEKKS